MSDIETQYRTKLTWHVLSRMSLKRFESIVDLGCGDGSNLRALALKTGAKRVKGIDLDTTEVQDEAIDLRRGNLLEFAPEQSYDAVISNQVFEHIYEPWLPKYYQVLKACCKPGGIIVISTPNRWRPHNIYRLVTFRRPYMMNANPGVPPEQHLGHHRECSYRQLQQLFERHFQPPEWHINIIRTVPQFFATKRQWMANLLIYYSFWLFWRPIFVSASQEHYVVIQRTQQ